MNISDYFTSQTRPIIYAKMPEGSWKIKEHWIVLNDPPSYSEPEDEGLTIEEQSKDYRKFYEKTYLGILNDNTCLAHYLSLIEEHYLSGAETFPYNLYALGHFRNNHFKDWVEGITEEIWGTFLCFKFLIWEDEEAYSTLFSRILIPLQEHYANDEDAWQYRFNESPEKNCWKYLRECSLRFSEEENGIRCGIRVVDARLEEYLYSSTLAQALLYQLFMHISMGKEGIYKKYKLANCELCHSQFMKKHGNQRFCEICAKNDVRVAAHRSKKKGEATHAP